MLREVRHALQGEIEIMGTRLRLAVQVGSADIFEEQHVVCEDGVVSEVPQETTGGVTRRRNGGERDRAHLEPLPSSNRHKPIEPLEWIQ